MLFSRVNILKANIDTCLMSSESKPASQSDVIKEEENGPPKLFEDPNESDEDVEEFVYPVNPPPVSENKESTVQTASAKSTLADDDYNNATGNGIAPSFPALECDMSGRKDDDAKQRENLIKKHYECKIAQLTEQVSIKLGYSLNYLID
jgi:hypothetical protein